jgi:hypothetical protein
LANFAQDVSQRDHHTLDQDVKLYFLVEAAAMDAFIACWDTKMTYDFARPYSLIHYYYKDKKIVGWAGPDAEDEGNARTGMEALLAGNISLPTFSPVIFLVTVQ